MNAATAPPPPPLGSISALGAGMMALGSYSQALQSQDVTRRRRFANVTASLVLAAIIGLAAVYTATSPNDRGSGPAPAAALVVSSTPAPTATTPDGPAMMAVGGPTDLPPEADVAILADTEAVGSDAAEQAIVTASEQVASEPDVAPSLTTVASMVDPMNPQPDGRETVATDPAIEDEPPVKRSGWICDGQVQLEDPRGRDWSLGRVSFLQGPGYERVVLHINRLGPGGGEPPTVTAEAFATSRVQSAVPGVPRPSLGKTTVSVHLTDGVKGNLGVRGYRPKGMENLKEFSVYPAPRGSSRVIVSAAAGKCFRLRAPAWSDSGPNTRTAQIILDLKS